MHPVWVGVAEVTRGPACLREFKEGTVGSFVWWAAQAMNQVHFKQRVETVCEHYGLLLYGFNDVQPAMMLRQPDDDLANLVGRAESDASFVLYGTFHNYRQHNS